MHIRCGRRLSILALLATVLCAQPAPAAAQDESALRLFFEGKRVVVTLDMPGTSDGIDLGVSGERLLDSQRYVQRLKTYGTAIHAGESATVSLVKVKKDLIEFQLGGGGFGTGGDDTATIALSAPLPKSSREKEIENAARDETNPRRRRELERQLDAMRAPREQENSRLEAARLEAEDRRRQHVADQRLHGGSRFNLRYDVAVPQEITPRDVMAALGPYVVFSELPASEPTLDGAGTLRKGMTRAEAERTLGSPTSAVEHQEGTVQVATVVFIRRNERTTAEFVEGVLIRFVIAPK